MPELGQNFCSYLVKTLAIVFGIIGIILTVQAGADCNFLQVEDSDGNPLDLIREGDRPTFVFAQATKFNLGIYKYEILEYENPEEESDGRGCIDFPQKFFQIDGYPSITTAQLCSLLAPIFCGLAIVFTLFDFCICTFPGSSIVGGLLFTLSMGIQCGTFALVADPLFCFEDSELECTLGGGMYMSIAAVIFYFLATVFSCAAPFSDPCYKNFTKRDDDNVVVEQRTTVTKTVNGAPVNPQPSSAPQSESSLQSPNETGGRQKARPSSSKDKYDKFGNRVF